MIVSASTSQSLAGTLASLLNEPISVASVDRFSDGELLAAVPGISTDRVIVVCSTVTCEAHIELLQLHDALREAGVSEITTVIPYLGYARQDAPTPPDASIDPDTPGYPVSIRAIARALSIGTDRILTINPHEADVIDHFTVPAAAVDASGRLADALPSALSDPVFVSPDAGAVDLATSVRDAYGSGDIDHFEKARLSDTQVELSPSQATVAERDVVLVDDIISTGSTMAEAISILRERDANRVFVTCVHPLFSGSALDRLFDAGADDVFGTDTIEASVSEVSVAQTIEDSLDI